MGQKAGQVLEAGCRMCSLMLPATRNETLAALSLPILIHTGLRMTDVHPISVGSDGHDEEKALALTTQKR